MGFIDDIKKMFSPKEVDSRTSLSKRVQSAPQDPQSRQKLGLYLLRQGEVVEGLDQLARAAVMYEKDGFATKAVAILRHMIKNDPANLEFLRWLIRLLSQEGLTADAQRELENIAGQHGLFSSEEQKIEFLRQAAESLPKSPLPLLFIADALCSRRKLHEAINELEKASHLTVSSRMVSEFSERLTAVVASAGENPEFLEPCGFLWLKVGKNAEGISLLHMVVDMEREKKSPEDVAGMERIVSAIRGGWDIAAAHILSFTDAARKLDEMAAPPPGPPAAISEDRPEKASPGRETGYREEDSIVMDALSRLQAKVEEEIGESDPDARYNLGIAYKEMGLLDEAIAEFRIARQKPELFVAASSLLADTLAAKGDSPAAMAALDEVLSSGAFKEEEGRNIRYQKAVLLSRDGKDEEAKEIFIALHAEAPEYLDVASRVESYRR